MFSGEAPYLASPHAMDGEGVACQISWKPLGDGKPPDISQSWVLRKKGGGAPVLARPLPFRLYP